MQILSVNSRTREVKFSACTDEEMRYRGRSFIAYHMLKEVDPHCDPLGRKNKLIISTGLLGDTSLTTAGRFSLGGKSPLTCGIKESNVGGISGKKMAKLGFKAIIIEDIPENKGCMVLVVKNDSAKLVEMPELIGAYSGAAIGKLKKEYGDKTAVIIGPTGEFKLSAAIVATTDHTGLQLRTAGRDGLGGVMGAKGIKSIVFDDSGAAGEKPVDGEKFKKASREVAGIIAEDPKIENRHDFGTPAVLSACNSLGILPTKNFSSGSFEHADAISGDRVAELILERGGEGKRGLPCVLGCTMETVKYLDLAAANGQVEISYRLLIRGALLDSLGICLFSRPAFVKNPDLIARLLNARHGWKLNYSDVRRMGIECLELEIAFNEKAGIDKTKCDIPEFMRTEPLPPFNTTFDIPWKNMNKIWNTTLEEGIF